MAGPGKWTLAVLEEHLVGAVELELTTIPPYLTALWSLGTETNQEAAGIVKSVVMEEMLHLALASNVLNAIGGHPEITAEHAPVALADTRTPGGERRADVRVRLSAGQPPRRRGRLGPGGVRPALRRRLSRDHLDRGLRGDLTHTYRSAEGLANAERLRNRPG